MQPKTWTSVLVLLPVGTAPGASRSLAPAVPLHHGSEGWLPHAGTWEAGRTGQAEGARARLGYFEESWLSLEVKAVQDFSIFCMDFHSEGSSVC